MITEDMFTIIILFSLFIIGESEIYIVTIEGEPVISYTGGVSGFEATAVEADETLDVTRFVFLKLFFKISNSFTLKNPKTLSYSRFFT